MTNAQHATENLTIHIKVKDYSTWRHILRWKREGPPLRGYHEWESVPQRRRPE